MGNLDMQVSKKTSLFGVKILQGVDGITEIKVGHPLKPFIMNTAPETREETKNRLPRHSWLSEIVYKL